jgi:hypothetical protein
VGLLSSLKIHIAKGPGGHGELRARLLNSGDEELIDLGSKLGDLHSRRISADYRLAADDIEEMTLVVSAVHKTAALLKVVAESCTEPRRGQIAKALQK